MVLVKREGISKAKKAEPKQKGRYQQSKKGGSASRCIRRFPLKGRYQQSKKRKP
jgi:hypothetical protein